MKFLVIKLKHDKLKENLVALLCCMRIFIEVLRTDLFYPTMKHFASWQEWPLPRRQNMYRILGKPFTWWKFFWPEICFSFACISITSKVVAFRKNLNRTDDPKTTAITRSIFITVLFSLSPTHPAVLLCLIAIPLKSKHF